MANDCIVVTKSKGQSVFSKIGAEKGILETPLLVIYSK